MTNVVLKLLLYLVLYLRISICVEELSSLLKYHSELCPPYDSRCDRDVGTVRKCCGYCDCGPNCAKYGSCCLTDQNNFSFPSQYAVNKRYGCVRPQYFATSKKTAYLRADGAEPGWMITKCEPSTADNNTQFLCENPGVNGFIHTVVPVYYNYEHYRNKFCAYCNGVPVSAELDVWRLEIHCKGAPLHAMTASNLLAVVEANKCNIFYRPPVNVHLLPEACRPQSYTISECNVTGLWPVYNLSIDIACNSFTDAFNMTYRNYFCYVCNTNNPLPKSMWNCKEDPTLPGTSRPPFLAILDLSAISRVEGSAIQLECDSETQYKDEKLIKCHDILCDNDRYLKDGECLLKDELSKNATCFVIFIKLIPGVGEIIYDQQMRNITVLTKIHFAFTDVVADEVETVDEFNIFTKSTFNETEGERIIDYVIVKALLHIAFKQETKILSDLIKRFHKDSVTVSVQNERMVFRTKLVSYDLSLFANIFKQSIKVPNENGSNHDVLERVPVLPAVPGLQCNNMEHVPFDRLHVCPFIEISPSDLPMEIVNGFLIINESFLHKAISRWDFRYISGKVFMCSSEYKTINDAMPYTSETTKSLTISKVGFKETLSLICICLSIVCLFATVIIYVSFTELHSQPGINTIILCASLILAQTVYQFGAGQTDVAKWACATIGAICHFLWLAVMFAMNVCSYEMLQIFRKLQKIPSKFSLRDTCKRLTYIIMLSLMFVFVNFIVSFSQSDGKESGYGGKICYLSSVRMHFLTFIIPSATTILVNFFFYFYVVIKIGQTRISTSCPKHERNYFGIYARLSTLTGVTWLLGFMQHLVSSEVLEYQFIVLNAGQGVFIMVAFIVNKRIVRLFRRQSYLSRTHQSKDIQDEFNKTKKTSEESVNSI